MAQDLTEQQWLGNENRARRGSALAELDRAEAAGVRQIGHPDRVRPAGDGLGSPWLQSALADPRAQAAAAEAITEADLIRGMRKALRPFDRPAAEPKQGWDFPRAGVRLRPDGRYQLRIWLDPTLPDAVQGGACETLVEACNLGAMICQYARDAA